MQLLKRKLAIETERLTLRPPVHADFRPWATLRSDSITYLTPWEPSWAPDHLSRKAFTNRVYWANRSVSAMTAMPSVTSEKIAPKKDKTNLSMESPG